MIRITLTLPDETFANDLRVPIEATTVNAVLIEALNQHWLHESATGEFGDSSWSISEGELTELDVACPVCQAKPGQMCTRATSTGRTAVTWFHLGREHAVGH